MPKIQSVSQVAKRRRSELESPTSPRFSGISQRVQANLCVDLSLQGPTMTSALI